MNTTPAHRLIAEVRAEMARQGVMPSTIAERTDMSRPTLSRKLNGKTELTLGELIRICEALDVLPSEIVRRAEGVVAA